jgi:hypothetical protein
MSAKPTTKDKMIAKLGLKSLPLRIDTPNG